MNLIPEFSIEFLQDCASYEIHMHDENLCNIGIEEKLLVFSGSRISRGLQAAVGQAISVYLEYLINQGNIFKIGNKWHVQKLLNIGDLIQIYLNAPGKWIIGMCISNKDNIYKINCAGDIKIFSFPHLLKLQYIKVS